MFNSKTGWLTTGNYLLFGFGVVIMTIQVWMVIEGLLIWKKSKGVLEPPLPPLKTSTSPQVVTANPNC